MNTCKKCHEIGKGCCLMKATNISNQIGLTGYDIKKIIDFTGKQAEHFMITDTITDEYRESLVNNIHPIFNKIYPNNTRHRLKTINEQCIFLNDKGCKLPAEIRPIYCRLYPFWLSPDNSHIIVLSSYDCLAQARSTLSWTVVNEHFGYTEEYVKKLFAELENNFY